jgi:hypothetical protein
VIHWVGGIKRSGTSMMMHCLQSDRLVPYYDRVYSQQIIKKLSKPGYKINHHLYELHPEDRRSPRLRHYADGKLVKLMGPHILNYAQPEDKVIFMMRDAEEVIASFKNTLGKTSMKPKELENISADILRNLQYIGCQIIPVWYQGVVDSPRIHFRMIDELGWPINYVVAANRVRPELHRFRKVGSDFN